MGNGMDTIKIGVLPGQVKEIAVNCNTTIAQAIAVADLGTDGDGYEIRLNGDVVNGDKVVGDGDKVLLTKKIQGN
jgi:sulfur carrier protein ThiS